MKCIFIGYAINSKGYRLWDPKAKCMHISRDIVFFEEGFDGRTSMLQYVERSSESSKTVPSSTIEDNTDDQDAVVDNYDATKDKKRKEKYLAVQQGLEGHLKERYHYWKLVGT